MEPPQPTPAYLISQVTRPRRGNARPNQPHYCNSPQCQLLFGWKVQELRRAFSLERGGKTGKRDGGEETYDGYNHQ